MGLDKDNFNQLGIKYFSEVDSAKKKLLFEQIMTLLLPVIEAAAGTKTRSVELAQDMGQVAALRIIKDIDTFDPNKGQTLYNWCFSRIGYAISGSFRNNILIDLPQGVYVGKHDIKRLKQTKLAAEGSADLSEEDLRALWDRKNLSPASARIKKSSIKCALEAPDQPDTFSQMEKEDNDGERSLASTIADPQAQDASSIVEEVEFQQDLRELVKTLDKREKFVILAADLLPADKKPLTHEEMGRRLGVCPTTVGRIREKAIKKLRRKFASHLRIHKQGRASWKRIKAEIEKGNNTVRGIARALGYKYKNIYMNILRNSGIFAGKIRKVKKRGFVTREKILAAKAKGCNYLTAVARELQAPVNTTSRVIQNEELNLDIVKGKSGPKPSVTRERLEDALAHGNNTYKTIGMFLGLEERDGSTLRKAITTHFRDLLAKIKRRTAYGIAAQKKALALNAAQEAPTHTPTTQQLGTQTKPAVAIAQDPFLTELLEKPEEKIRVDQATEDLELAGV